MLEILIGSVLLAAQPAALLPPERCVIENAERTHMGPDRAIEGTCSNSGLRIRCTRAGQKDAVCIGPAGTYSGTDLDSLVYSACGCGD